jgi:glycosyltransferase involved in cell wall biosynthesis
MGGVPLVSVIVATNRTGPFLAETVASVRAQTYPSWELVLVDDGSPDPDAIDEVATSVDGATVVHQANAGVSVARNVGISRSSGAYLAFLDDDDTWDPDRLSRQVAAMEDHPEAVASYCQLDVIDGEGRVLGTGRLGPGDAHSILRGETTTPIPTLLVARTALERVGLFHPMMPPAEDLDLIYRLARTGPFVFVPETLVHYRRHGANESGNLRSASLASRRALEVQKWWSTQVSEADILDDLRAGLRHSRRYWTDQLVREAAHQARAGNLAAAGRTASFVARHDPVNGIRALPGLGLRWLRPRDRPDGR